MSWHLKIKGIKIDPEDEHLLTERPWYVTTNGYIYACQYTRQGGKKKHIRLYLHRTVMGAKPGEVVDHIDGDRFNNTKSNLRITTFVLNVQNRTGLDGKNTSGHRGVSWSKRLGKWHAQAGAFGKMNHIGYFNDKLEAAKAAAKWRSINMPGSVEFLEAQARQITPDE